MKIFKITEQELQTIANVLAEFPAKHVIGALDILRNLKPTEVSQKPVEDQTA